MGGSASRANAEFGEPKLTKRNRFMQCVKHTNAYAAIVSPRKPAVVAPPPTSATIASPPKPTFAAPPPTPAAMASQPTPSPQKSVPQEWVGGEVALLEAQANKLRRAIARRRASTDSKGAAPIMDHYEQVLKDIEHQIAKFHQ